MINTAYYGSDGTQQQNMIVGSFVNQIVFGKHDSITDHLSMGVHDSDGTLIAGTLYHNYYKEHGTVELTSGSFDKRWLTRPVIRAMFYMPFHLLDCQACVLRVSSKNAPMLKIARSFGFQEVVLPRLFGRDNDMHVFTMTDDMWAAHKVNTHG